MNPGGIRDDLLFAEISGSEAPGEVTYGEAFVTREPLAVDDLLALEGSSL